MTKYILDSEKKKASILLNDIRISNIDYLKKDIDNILYNCKDFSIEDIINYILDSLINELRPLLTNNITPGIEIGLKNNYFQLISYGGKYNINSKSKDIENDTYFSFDSISKLITAVITMQELKSNNIPINSKINEYNNDFLMDASFESILKYTAYIKTPKRIDNLSKEETITILKNIKENIKEKNKYINYYEYNDIGYMILRQAIYNFTNKLDNLLQLIDNNNLTYKNIEHKSIITGGKLGEEYITPDQKGRGINFPGHTGLYGNIEGLINIFDKIIYSNDIINNEDRKRLFSQPYTNPTVYDINGNIKIGKNGSKQDMAKVSGIYRLPNGINNPNYSKIASCDMSDKTTNEAKASTGTCGSWIVTDNLNSNNKFGKYIGGFLTNPYSCIETKNYKDNERIPGTPHIVNQKGVILRYQTVLNKYKEIITKYGIILEIITEYIKEIDINALKRANKAYIKKMTK
ncbi:MAG: hypothetical protein IKF19_04895 [Bacilli bacterium]|nr:hypothetical protein [Bacilli bacterium]